MDVLTILLLLLSIQSVSTCSFEQDGKNVTATCYREMLDEIPDDVLDLTTHIQFGSNRISNISFGMLERFFNLKVLNLSHNYISESSFKADLFTNIRSLSVLDLQRNRIRQLTSPFIRNAQLTVLRLDSNDFIHIPADFLVNLPRLSELSFSNCKIQTISGQAFRSIGAHLRTLDLSGNQLVTMSSDLQEDIFSNSLQAVKLHNNFWNCDCELKWLKEGIEVTKPSWFFKGYSLRPQCENPMSLKHKSWFSVRSEQFGCAPQLVNPPPRLPPTISYRSFSLGEDVTLTCLVHTKTIPHMVQWLQDDVTTDYKARLVTSQQFNGTLLNTTLTIRDISSKDYGLYKCDVNTTFGFLRQICNLTGPDETGQAARGLQTNAGVIVAIVIVCVIITVILALIVTFYVKKHVAHQGRLYMGGSSSRDASHKSDIELSGNSASEFVEGDVTITTPLTMSAAAMERDPAQQPDVIKLYAEDELDSIPADMEYPADDAGCAEYNQYLEAVSSANHSPAFIDAANQHLPAYVDPNHTAPYVIDTNLMRTASPALSNHDHPLASSGAPLINRPNHIAPYMEGHTSSSESGDSITDPVIISRMSTTPSGSPLTFIKEEPDEEEMSSDLL